MNKRSSKKKRFEYKPRTREQLKKRAEARTGSYDSYLSDQVSLFKVKSDVEYTIRILPPTWEDAEHYGYDAFVHYGIGADDNSYICPKHHGGGNCPICDERERADARGDEEYARELAPTKRVLCWIIDRENEEDGPIVWGMPQTVDKEIARRATGKGTNEVLPIDDPEDGYDVDFAREGTGFKTKYVGIEIARRSSPLHDDPEVVEAWLDYVVENPLPDLLVVHDYDYINKVFAGSVATESEAEEEGEEEEEEEKPKRIRPKRGSAKKQVEEEEEEDEDDEEDEAQEESEAEEEGEEEEEEEPTRRSAKSTLNKLRSRRRG